MERKLRRRGWLAFFGVAALIPQGYNLESLDHQDHDRSAVRFSLN